jgi:hemoglobin-like flavoprotein
VTPEQLALVRETALLVDAAGDAFALRFYDHLFARHPAARGLFPEELDVPLPESRAAHRAVLADEVVFLVAAAADLPAFLERARGLGGRHQHYGVHAADYPLAGEAFVAAVGDVAGDAWSAEAEAAWRRMYALIAETMLEGASGELFSSPD